MKFEEKNRMSRRGLARFFKGLSELVEKDMLKHSGERLRLGESVDVEVGYKEKKGRAKFEIELKWQISGGVETKDGSGEKETVSAIIGESVSEVKQDLKKSFNSLRKIVEKGTLLTAADVENFVSIIKRYKEIAVGDGYESDLLAFAELTDRFKKAVKSGNLDETQNLIGKMRAAKKSCHKTYRWKEE